MKVLMLDITGRNPVQYNPSLCEGLAKALPGSEITLASTKDIGSQFYKFKKLITLVPEKWISSEGVTKRILRTLELFLNYISIAVYILEKKPDILHIQWLPMIEFFRGERIFIILYKLLDSKLKVVLTVHNVYPHNCKQRRRGSYKKRFQQIDSVIDSYMVHLYCSKESLKQEFGIDDSKVFVAYHGIFKPKAIHIKESQNNYIKHLIMYGYQNHYKGTDILLDALTRLPNEYIGKLRTTIVGRTDPKIFECYKDKCEMLNVEWINKFVSDEELYSRIAMADIILLPYRAISQSGVLLLALSYRKPIITSDLPSFKETLEGYPDDYFFKAEDSTSLSHMLQNYLDGVIDENRMKAVIDKLNKKYSWSETAESTIKAYYTCFNKSC